MSYLVLARKWRPRKFDEIVGQEHVVRAMTNALQSGRLHHAYLFSGTRGVGKTTIARILAKAINCAEGPTSDPCGQCTACTEIDDGRFVDLIEVDAASRTKVDDTRDLLDNVQFAPAGGRFKVYLIDEVHMLSRHSFNALLKTLEEPPPHVKFLLATTDPQKLPVTVLSRCLQFNLKRLVPRLIRDRLQFICEQENIEADNGALAHIAQAADGSLRDALSLLDQAIAYCGGDVREQATADMLGTIDRRHVAELLQQLAAGDARGVMKVIDDIDEQFPDYARLLDELARKLQRIAVAQVTGPGGDDDGDVDSRDVDALLDRFSAEDLQLYYQVAVTGRRDLPLAPDARSGVEMTLLRMLAFRPGGHAKHDVPAAAPARPEPRAAAPGRESTPVSSRTSAGGGQPPDAATTVKRDWDGIDWAVLVSELNLKGAVRLLASNCSLSGREGDEVMLVLDPAAESYLTPARERSLSQALEASFGEPLKARIRIGQASAETPMQAETRRKVEDIDAAKQSLENDPNVRTIIDMFGAKLNPESVRVVEDQAESAKDQ